MRFNSLHSPFTACIADDGGAVTKHSVVIVATAWRSVTENGGAIGAVATKVAAGGDELASGAGCDLHGHHDSRGPNDATIATDGATVASDDAVVAGDAAVGGGVTTPATAALAAVTAAPAIAAVRLDCSVLAVRSVSCYNSSCGGTAGSSSAAPFSSCGCPSTACYGTP